VLARPRHLLGLVGVVRVMKLAWHAFLKNVELKNFCHHNPCIVEFPPSMDLNIILEYNVINSIDFYIKF